MSTMTGPLSLDNPVFKAYLFYSGILVIKILLMAALTARYRFTKRIFSSPEDTKIIPKSKVQLDDPDVERVRRAHLNDLENIPIFFAVGFAYVMTNPTPWVAVNLFRIVTLGRVLHTIVYAVIVIPQPARVIAYFMALIPTAYMAVTVVVHFF